MDDLSSSITPEMPSTVIDTETTTAPSGGGAPKTIEAAPSLRDVIADEVKKGDAEAAKPDPKPTDAKADDKADAKAPDDKPAPVRAENGKFATTKPQAEAAEQNGTAPANDQAEKTDGKHYTDAPKNFLPDAKEMWRNVPRPVRRDIEIMTRQHGEEVERLRASNDRYESIRPFDELARSNGRDLQESLTKMNQVENALQRDPVYGLNEILREIGPRKADGSAYTIFELAQNIAGAGSDAFQQHIAQATRSQPQAPDPRIEQAQSERAQLEARLIEVEVIGPFKAEHPRYEELQEPIAAILKSGMVPASLSAPERLEAAYVMAERLNPPSSQPANEAVAPAPDNRAAPSLDGVKSIRSAPGAVSPDMEPVRGGSIRELLEDEMRRQKRA